jgi:magnesium chelatase family protein
VAERMGLSARGYHRVLRVARTIADLDGSVPVRLPHVAEAVSYRLAAESQPSTTSPGR